MILQISVNLINVVFVLLFYYNILIYISSITLKIFHIIYSTADY